MAAPMDDDEIYAFEQEMQEMDEWEEMHAHEMEAAEEELRALDAAERKRQQPAAAAAPTPAVGSQDVTVNLDDRFAATQTQKSGYDRVQSVLDRCAAALGETEGEEPFPDTEMMDDYVARKEKASKLDATTAQYLLVRPPIDSDSMTIVLPSGERRFLRKRIPMMEPRRPPPPSVATDSLIPIAELMDVLEKRQIEAAVRADSFKASAPSPRASTASNRDTTLWLDKYKPQRFVDLLSDEKTNREVLAWIKQWDKFVFPGKKAYQPTWTELESFNTTNNRSNGFGNASGSKWKNGGFEKDEAKADENDLRPREKIILICGPPGAGKTTLANIVARHAGYNPIEVNASDDRTSGVLKNKIINAMEMQSIWGDNKPNCIILDEIDGAMNGGDGKSAIAAIQEIVSAPLHVPSKDGKKSTSRRSDKHPLTRPLICICNDQYASVLRPLRKLAKIFVLDTPNSQRLVSRLKVICRDEGLKSTTGALAALCTSGGNDVRYCVNALQFQSAQTKHITSAAVAAGLVGQKDYSRTVFETMDMVFYQTAKAKASSVMSQAILDQIDEASHGLGNYSLLVNALDENLPKMIFNDPTMSKICDAFEWMGLADSWDTAVRADQQFSLMPYIPFAARAVHLACCTSSRRRVEYPKTHADASKKHDKTRNILQAFVENSHMQQSMRSSADVLVVDVVPWLLATLSPNVRHLTANMQSEDEKAKISRLIELMSTLGLSFRPKYMPDGSEDYVLEPPIHEVVEFRDPDNHGQLVARGPMVPLAVRKMITREVELEQMRKTEANEMAKLGARSGRGKGGAAAAAATASATKKKPAISVSDQLSEAAQQFVLPVLTDEQEAAKMEAIRKRNPFAFAHREAKRKRDAEAKEVFKNQHQPQDASSGATPMEGIEGDGDSSCAAKRRASVRYRFNEGYTSGIKTPVYMRDILG